MKGGWAFLVQQGEKKKKKKKQQRTRNGSYGESKEWGKIRKQMSYKATAEQPRTKIEGEEDRSDYGIQESRSTFGEEDNKIIEINAPRGPQPVQEILFY